MLAEKLRDDLAGLTLLLNCGGGSLKAQLRRADRADAQLALILGEDELAAEAVTVKHLREDREQERIAQSGLVAFLKTALVIGQLH
jgi:histidyl-tRNA synthetase